MKRNLLPEDTEYKPWFLERRTDDNGSTNPSINFSARNGTQLSSSTLHDEISRMQCLVATGIPTTFFFLLLVLGRVFKRVGVDADSKQLDSRRSRLAMQLTNEFVMNSVLLSTQDLHSLIQFYLDKRQSASEDRCRVRQTGEICVH